MLENPILSKMMIISIVFMIKYMRKANRVGKNLTRIESYKLQIGTSIFTTQRVQTSMAAIPLFAVNVRME